MYSVQKWTFLEQIQYLAQYWPPLYWQPSRNPDIIAYFLSTDFDRFTLMVFTCTKTFSDYVSPQSVTVSLDQGIKNL